MPRGKLSDSDSDTPQPSRKGKKAAGSDDEFDFSDDDRKKKPVVSRKKKTSKPSTPPPAKKKMNTSVAAAAVQQADGDDSDDSDEDMNEKISDENLLQMEIPPMEKFCQRADGTGERLMIKDIKVTNFKSYYGTQTIGPFHKNFSAIVGPNGSGKSNVIDSLLFVFGYKATRIRSKKLAVLIHKSAAHPDIHECRVEISFQKIVDKSDDDFDVVPGSSFSVSRTVTRAGQSTYRMNDRAMSIKQVAERLREVGIDLKHNRFLILQGEVEQIAMMKPKALTPNEEGMLEYLEDIIGSSRYKMPLERLSGKLEELTGKKAMQMNQVKRAEEDKKLLEKPVLEMVSTMRLQNKLALIHNKQHHKKMHEHMSAWESLEPQKEELKKREKEAEAELAAVLDKQKEAEGEIKGIEDAHTKAESELDRVRKELSEHEQKEEKRKKDLERCKETIKKLNADLVKENKKLDEARKVPEKSRVAIDTNEQTVEEAKEQQEQAQRKLDANLPIFTAETAADQAEKQRLETELAPLVEKRDKVAGELTLAQAEKEMLSRAGDQHAKRLDDVTRAIADAVSVAERGAKEVEHLNVALPKMKEEMAAARAEREKEGKRGDEISEKIRIANGKLDEEKQNMSKVTGSRTVRAVMEEKQRNPEFAGVLGRLGDLGGIDKKYDCAVSTASGNLNHVIVETEGMIHPVKRFLQENKAGRLNMLVLEKQDTPENWQRIRNKRQYPEGVPRLFDLVRCSDQLKPAFYFGLGETLVAEDIAQARRVGLQGKERFRVVTLNGDLVDPSGSMTGGGNKSTGLMGTGSGVDTSRDVAAIMAELTREIATYNDHMHENRNKTAELDRTIHRLTNEIGTVTGKLRTVEMDVKKSVEKKAHLEKQLVELQAAAAKNRVDTAKVDECAKRIATLEKEREECNRVSDEMRDRVDEVDVRIKEVHDKLIKVHQDAVSRASSSREKALSVIAKETSAINSAQRNIAKAEQRVAALEKDVEEKEEERTELEEAADDTKGKETVRMAEKKKELEDEVKELSASLKKAREGNGALNEAETTANKVIATVKEEMEKVRGEMANEKMGVKACEKKIAALTLHDIASLGLCMPNEGGKSKKSGLNFDDDPLEMDAEEEEEVEKRMREKKREQERKMKGKKKREDVIEEEDEEGEGEEGDSDSGDEEKRRKKKEEDEKGDEDDEGEDEMDENEDGEDGTLPTYTRQQTEKFEEQELAYHATNIEQQLSSNKKEPLNMRKIEEYKIKVDKYMEETRAYAVLDRLIGEHRRKHDDFKKSRLDEFMDGFTKIGVALKEMYQMITLGGDASIELMDSLDPFQCGIQFMVRPPKKSWKQIANLSGGEKTLSSLALVFALHKFRPTPLYVMDEIDAALDFRNVSIIGHYIKDRTKNAQFVIISLRNNMFELGDRLVGIYKVRDCTRNVVVDPRRVLEESKEYHIAPLHKYKEQVQDENEDVTACRKRPSLESPGVSPKRAAKKTLK